MVTEDSKASCEGKSRGDGARRFSMAANCPAGLRAIRASAVRFRAGAPEHKVLGTQRVQQIHQYKVDRPEKHRQGWLAPYIGYGYLPRRVHRGASSEAELKGPEYDRERVGAYLGLGAALAASIGLFAFLGWLLDRSIGTSPVFTGLGAFLGGVAGFYYVVRHALDLQKGERGGDRKADGRSESSGEPPTGQ